MMKFKECLKSISLMVIIAATVFICGIFSMYLSSIQEAENNYEKLNRQDFIFSAQAEEVPALSEKYAFEYNAQGYKVVYSDDLIFRILTDSRTIDLPYYYEGQAPNEGEIALNKQFCEKHNLQIGNSMMLDNKNYTISAYFTVYDYISPVISESGSLFLPSKQALVFMADIDYRALSENETIRYSAVFHKGSTNDPLKMHMDEGFLSLVFAEENPSAGQALQVKYTMFSMIVSLTGGILGIISLVTVIMAISRQIEERKACLGVFKAMGYSKWSLAASYAKFSLPILVGAVIGFLLATLFLPLIGGVLNEFLLLPPIKIQFYLLPFICLIVAPVLLFGFAAFLFAAFLLRRSPIEMLRNSPPIKPIKDIKVQKMSQKTFFEKHSSFISSMNKNITGKHIGTVILVAFAGFAFCAELILGLSMFSIPNELAENLMQNVAYESNVRFLVERQIEDDAEVTGYFENECSINFNGKSLSSQQLISLNDSRSLLKLSGLKGEDIHIARQDGIVINRWHSLKLGVKRGDTVKLTIKGKVHELKVSQIENSLSGENIYLNLDLSRFCAIINEDSLCNGAYYAQKVTFDKNMHVYIINRNDIENAVLSQSSSYILAAIMMTAIGFILGGASVILSLRALMGSIKKYLAMMKALGYNDKEIGSAVFKPFRLIGWLGGVIGMGYSYLILFIVFHIVSLSSTSVIPLVFNIWQLLIVAALFLIVYEIVLMLNQRSVKRIGLKEIMIN